MDAIPSQSVQADEESFGAGIGRSLRRTGAVVRQAADQEFALKLRFAEMEAETQALDASTEYTRQSNKIVNDFRQLNGQQAVNALPGVEKSLVDLDKEIGKSVKSPAAQRAYKSRSGSILTSGMQVTGLHAANQARAANDAAKVGAIGAAQSRFVTNFGLTDTKPDLDEIVSLTADLAYERGLPKEAADLMLQANVGGALKQAMGVRVSQGKFDEARAIFDEAKVSKIPGTDLPVFSADDMVVVTNQLEQAENLERIDRERQIAAADKYKRDQSEASYKKYVDQIIIDPTKLDIKKVAQDPYLSGQHGETLLRLYQEQINKLKGGADPDANKGPGFWDAFRAVTASQPTITSQQQIYDLTGPGRPLSIIGANALVSLMNGRKTGDQKGDYDAQRVSRFFTNMENKVTDGSNGVEEKDRAFQFYMDKSRALEEGKKNGKTIDQMLDPKSTDYIGKDWETYKVPLQPIEEVPPPPEQASWFGWLGTALFGGGAEPFSTQMLDQKLPSGADGVRAGNAALKAALAAGYISKDAAMQYSVRRGWSKPSAPTGTPPAGQTVPPAVQ